MKCVRDVCMRVCVVGVGGGGWGDYLPLCFHLQVSKRRWSPEGNKSYLMYVICMSDSIVQVCRSSSGGGRREDHG